jgi:hypothetical protein
MVDDAMMEVPAIAQSNKVVLFDIVAVRIRALTGRTS